MKKTQEVATLSEEQLAVLNENYPVNDEESRMSLPRFGMLAKDIVKETGSGKSKKIEIVQAAGTFFTEQDKGEVNTEGKKIWTKDFIEEEEVDVIIAFHRRQLRMFDASLEKFYSSSIYDTAEQIVPLYLDKQIVKRGTQKELQDMWPALTQKGKPTSKLKEETILYVVYEGVLHQMTLSQSSKWEFKTYKKAVNPSTVLTTLGSVEETFGTNTYKKVTFKNKRLITPDEFEQVNTSQTELKVQVEADSKFFLENGAAEAEYNKLGAPEPKTKGNF